ncbi:MAG TPA: dimethylsulfoniopropionate demethylase [Alphaproteobacteria bacterium]|nr:dimethylsulfoniopropionate demethylase [Alphaproteobacteria bacterium]|tara:strand:- start:3434 stop:4585 length:1152 start_codon:yes stop_codon:yes gene_type:complete
MGQAGLNMSRRIRRTPFTDRVEAHGVRGFSVVNHMLLPKAFEADVEDDYLHLRQHVQIWDVSVQRQVQIIGPDAARLVQIMTPRDLRGAETGQCLYVPLIDQNAGMLNDPVLLKLAEDRFWLSIADSDILLWARGLAIGMGLDVVVDEPDVSPLAIQGPKAQALMTQLFGDGIAALGHFRFGIFDVLGTRQLIARSGYSKQGGYEIYLQDSALGSALWDLIWDAGTAYNIRPGCPNLIERIEGGLMSYGNEFTRENNPLECGFGPLCHLGNAVDYIGKTALRELAATGPQRMLRGIKFGDGPSPPCGEPFPVTTGPASSSGGQSSAGRDEIVGQITSGIYSPRLGCNVGMSMIEKTHWEFGTRLFVHTPDGKTHNGTVEPFPF